MRAGWHASLLVLLTATVVVGLYEEQAGENDWHSEFVGQAINTQVSDKDRLIVSTSSNVLASLSLDTGKIAWRQIFHETDQLQSFTVLSKPATVISLSSSGSLLRAWRADDGALLWEKYLESASQNAVTALSSLAEAAFGSGEGIAVVTDGSIEVCLSRRQAAAPSPVRSYRASLICCRSTRGSKAACPGKHTPSQLGRQLATLWSLAALRQMIMQWHLLGSLTGLELAAAR